jgi:hypothetical protein
MWHFVTYAKVAYTYTSLVYAAINWRAIVGSVVSQRELGMKFDISNEYRKKRYCIEEKKEKYMPDRTVTMPHIVGCRLTDADYEKLQMLCTHSQRPASELLRLLIRIAQPVDVPPIRFATLSDQEAHDGR